MAALKLLGNFLYLFFTSTALGIAVGFLSAYGTKTLYFGSSVFIQIIPLGTDWAAENYYGEPAARLGLRYIGYKSLTKESSLYTKHPKNDPVLTDPNSVTSKRWELTKKIYLDHQNVRLNLLRFRKRLARAYYYSISASRQCYKQEMGIDKENLSRSSKCEAESSQIS